MLVTVGYRVLLYTRDVPAEHKHQCNKVHVPRKIMRAWV